MIANFRRLFLTALAAGLVAGVLTSAIGVVTTTPLILAAEVFESGGPPASHDHASHDHATSDNGQAASEPDEPPEWAPEDGGERFFFTAVANSLTGIGFALVLVAAYMLGDEAVTGRRGVVWGLAGYAVFALAPGLGLPPEIPGSIAAELAERQGWWWFAVGATALGLWLMVFGDGLARRVLGLVALVAPHAVGAPHPEAIGGAGPPELAAQFAATSLVVNAIFWVILGWVSGTVYARFDRS